MSYNKKFRKVIEEGEDISNYIAGTILSILGLVFFSFVLEEYPISFGIILTIISILVVYGWINYFKERKVYWEEIK